MPDFCPIKRIDHLEFFVGNARQAAVYYETCFGFRRTAYRGLETGSRDSASYVLEQGDIRFVFTTPLGPDHAAAAFLQQHGDGVGVIALEVPDAAAAFHETTNRGAEPAMPPAEVRDEKGVLRTAAIHAYGDTLIGFVERDDYAGTFAPGFRPVPGTRATTGVLKAIDHIVGNVELGEMEKWVRFFAETMGFTQLIHFDDKTISTEYSALMSKVMQDGTGRVKFPINEPATGKRKSQIQEYLDYYRGPGVQHIACATDDLVKAVRHLRASGVEFLRV
ncbi:MAG: 4-hydroxyphenylpyruvate dioxygenase, partial [Acidobacteria bacterium]